MSLTTFFTPEQIQEHIMSLRPRTEENQAEGQRSAKACRLCREENLTFQPPPMYCTACGARIKLNAWYYTTKGSGDPKHYFCSPCHSAVRSDFVEMNGMRYRKDTLEKKRNDEFIEEAWVLCDKCHSWQHQVCALFNGRLNEDEKSEYICPTCLILDLRAGEREPKPPSALSAGATDLPKTFLSDHIERRLTRGLRREQSERAKALGVAHDEVPRAEALVVRVVSSVDKTLEVKQQFLEIFKTEEYPTQYPYKSKAVLLFQKIEGVDVCLFGMYVQEFGVESSLPNQRRIYLAYLDSVKHFRPADVKTTSGESLRSFVYHEILIGYLDYCKHRGFSSCYIWACPPLKGDDYILYCHPEVQKTPNSANLRDWYLTMLQKASDERIVVEITNLYDFFFVSTGECRAKVTAARLPYFGGDYWPEAAEDILVQLQEEEDARKKAQEEEDALKDTLRKGKAKMYQSNRSSSRLATNASKDTQLMQRLGASILRLKEDFIMVHMHHACTHCRLFIVTGQRWVCEQCNNFQLCDICYDAEEKRDKKDRHPIYMNEVHDSFRPIEVTEADVPVDTKDSDEIMQNDIFDTRQAFLSLCQGNYYQYDTLRRAKHSSMMALFHLHNPTAPAFAVNCNSCQRVIEGGNGWHCHTCADFDLCNDCKDSAVHPHELTPIRGPAAPDKDPREQRDQELQGMRDLLAHASRCGLKYCLYPKCRSVRALFSHSSNCTQRVAGGCRHCKRVWFLLEVHARACVDDRCRIPRCRDVREQIQQGQQEMEWRRRMAAVEMLRQRAAEEGSSSSQMGVMEGSTSTQEEVNKRIRQRQLEMELRRRTVVTEMMRQRGAEGGSSSSQMDVIEESAATQQQANPNPSE